MLTGLAALASVAAAQAQVACTSPDALCTGDPCVIPTVTVTSPCELDFGDRHLVVQGRLTVPAGGVLTLHAGSMLVSGGVEGRSGHAGPRITLRSDGDMETRARIRSAGDVTPGSVVLEAGGTIALRGNVMAPTSGTAGSPAGSVRIEAQGAIDCRACRTDVRGRPDTAAGEAILRGRLGVRMPLGSHWDAGGRVGGNFEISSAEGPVFVETDIRARATSGAGGTFLVAAPAVTLKRDIAMEGGTGGRVAVLGDDVTVGGVLSVVGKSGAAGTIAVGGTTRVQLLSSPRAQGRTAGGTITVTGATVTVKGKPTVRGQRGPAGAFRATATDGPLVLDGTFDARQGGTIAGSATGDLTARGRFYAAPGGCIGLDAGGTLATAGATFDVPLGAGCP